MNKYPVIFISLKDIEGETYEQAYKMLESDIAFLFKSYQYIIDEKTDPVDVETFMAIRKQCASETEIITSLYFLSQLLYSYYGRKVILLIDEYDVPLAKADQAGYYSQMLNIIRRMFSKTLKGNQYMLKAVLTGCLRVSKESIFTGLNNLNVYSLTESEYSSAFGFTETEVKCLLEKAELEDKAEIVKTWYDGYNIGKDKIYCPWDVIKYISSLIAESSALPQNYWAGTSGNDAIKKFIELYKEEIEEDYVKLIQKKSIQKRVKSDLTYGELYSSPDNIWTLLFQTGYLTLKEKYDPRKETALCIPNEEIRNLFKLSIDSYFSSIIQSNNSNLLLEAIWKKNPEKIADYISSVLMESISYHDYSESFYHGILVGLLKGKGYYIDSNSETGLGRSDIVIRDEKEKRIAILELKKSSSFSDMEKDAEKAIEQINVNRYDTLFKSRYKTILKYGIAFFKKMAFAVFSE